MDKLYHIAKENDHDRGGENHGLLLALDPDLQLLDQKQNGSVGYVQSRSMEATGS